MRNDHAGIRVLYITHYSELYGANNTLVNLLAGLDGKITPFVLMPREGMLVNKLTSMGIACACVGRLFGYEYWMHSKPLGLFDIVKRHVRLVASLFITIYRILKWRIQIVETNSAVICVGALAARCTGRKHIWNVKEYGYEYGYEYDYGNKFSLNFMERLSDVIVAISDDVLKYYASLIGRTKLKRIYPVIDTRRFTCDVRDSDNSVLNLVFVGLLKENKNHLDAIRAVGALARAGDINIHLMIIGDGAYENVLREEVRQLDLQSRIEFLGYQKDVAPFLAAADIGLICSDREAFGLVTIEYMLSGLPVIGADSGGTTEIIVNGKTGFLYQHKNVDDLVEKIKTLYASKEMRREFGRNGRERALTRFEPEKQLDAVINVYDSLMQHNT